MKLNITLINGSTLTYINVRGLEFTGSRFIIDHDKGSSSFNLKEVTEFMLS
jgi:hypothetical protein